jgi:hypothetical protein
MLHLITSLSLSLSLCESCVPRICLFIFPIFGYTLFIHLSFLYQNCSCSLNSVFQRCDNRMHFARQGSASQGYFMRQATIEEVFTIFLVSDCCLINFSGNWFYRWFLCFSNILAEWLSSVWCGTQSTGRLTISKLILEYKQLLFLKFYTCYVKYKMHKTWICTCCRQPAYVLSHFSVPACPWI